MQPLHRRPDRRPGVRQQRAPQDARRTRRLGSRWLAGSSLVGTTAPLRRSAPRYNNTDTSFQAMIHIAATTIALRWLSTSLVQRPIKRMRRCTSAKPARLDHGRNAFGARHQVRLASDYGPCADPSPKESGGLRTTCQSARRSHLAAQTLDESADRTAGFMDRKAASWDDPPMELARDPPQPSERIARRLDFCRRRWRRTGLANARGGHGRADQVVSAMTTWAGASAAAVAAKAKVPAWSGCAAGRSC